MEEELFSDTQEEILSDEGDAGFYTEEPVLTSVPPETEAYMSVSDYGKIAVSSIPIGVLCGAIFMIVGLGVLVIVKIFKKA